MREVNDGIFRRYDIRGRAAEDLTEEVVTHLGRAYGTVIRRSGGARVALGRDCRTSGARIMQNFEAGVRAAGVDVVRLGVVPTPVVYFSLHHYSVDGGVVITGSHNPPAWNGFKLCNGKNSMHGEQITGLCSLMKSEDYTSGDGAAEDLDPRQDYIDWIAQNVKPAEGHFSVVIDAGNGTGGIVAGELYRALGASVTELYCEPDGAFPNHHPDPTVEENLVELKAKVMELGADLGIAFDGDADRIGAIDPKGRVVWGDQLMTFFGKAVLEVEPGARIVGEVKCSKVMYDELRAAGAQIEMWKVGHSLIKARMKEIDASLAGEMSGHLFFADRYFGFDDAVYAGARLIELLSRSSRSLDQMVDALPIMFATPELRVACSDSTKFMVTERVAAYFRSQYPVIDVDGVRIEFDHGWGLVRASNTQPVLVMRFEAASPEARDAYRAEVEAWLRANEPEVDFDADTHH